MSVVFGVHVVLRVNYTVHVLPILNSEAYSGTLQMFKMLVKNLYICFIHVTCQPNPKPDIQ